MKGILCTPGISALLLGFPSSSAVAAQATLTGRPRSTQPYVSVDYLTLLGDAYVRMGVRAAVATIREH
jgi:hypothetical protein